jgi:DNA-directed RNA polymerase specialized sigma24 family protein
MERLQIPHLLDERGQPLNTRLERLLRRFIPTLRRQFPAIRDDELELTEILEEGGRRFEKWEQQSGRPLDEEPYRFAWAILFNIGRSRMDRDPNRLRHDTIGAEAGQTVLSTLPSKVGTAKQIEDAVRVREAHDCMTEKQWSVCGSKAMGYSAEEIGEEMGISPAAVNMVFSRAKRKVFRRLTVRLAAALGRGTKGASKGLARSRSAHNDAHTQNTDGELTPALRLARIQRRE